ncbi:MAG TPA: exo-alpha-sialidase [Planctomycetia bacterium]|nr:exo-alpha-sialidase [Planctomycetia bacterium]
MHASPFVCAALFLFGGEPASRLLYPPDKLHSHSACVTECPSGDLIACWYRGSGERRADDVRIMGARLRKGAAAWSEPFLMADTPGYPDCNPVAYVDSKKQLWLFWPTIIDHRWEGAILKAKRATKYDADGPPAWDFSEVVHLDPKDLTPQLEKAFATIPEAVFLAVPKLKGYLVEARRRAADGLYHRLGWMPRCRPLEHNGKLILPLYCDTFSLSLLAWTKDDGATWETGAPILDLGAVQPSVVVTKDGRFRAFMRDNGGGGRMRAAESADEGKTWKRVWKTAMPNPGASVDAIALKSGPWVVAANDTTRGRHRLSLAVSTDEGETWKVKRRLENFEPEKGSGGYPSILQAADGTIHVLYTYTLKGEAAGETIKHVAFEEAWLMAGDEAAKGVGGKE